MQNERKPLRSTIGKRKHKYSAMYKPEFVEQARKLCQLGARDQDLCDFFEVGDKTINRWKHTYPEFNKALQVGKAPANSMVERSLYQRARGYSYLETKCFLNKQGEIVTTTVTVHVPPDVQAQQFWLRNRDPARWRDVTKHVFGIDGDAIRQLEQSMTKQDMQDHFLNTMRTLPYNPQDDEGDIVEGELVEAGDAKGEQPAKADAKPRSAKLAKAGKA
jgi:hypothetical protein